MKEKHNPAFLYEVERVLYESSALWEGIDAQQIPLGVGEVVLRTQPGFAAAMPLRFDSTIVEQQLDQAIEIVESTVPWCLWIIGPSSRPEDLKQRLMKRGFSVRVEWEGLALSDLSCSIPSNPDVIIEPLSWDNADDYAKAIAGTTDASHRNKLLSQAHRFLQRSPREVQIDIARLNGEVVGYAVLRIEPNKIAYLRNAMTVPAFRHQGVYLSLIAHRLAAARTAGCIAAVLQAQTKTSTPILMKRGFEPVCHLVGLTRKHPESLLVVSPNRI